MIYLLHEDTYVVERWHIFLIYLVYMLGACVINIFGLRLLPLINKTAIFWLVSTSPFTRSRADQDDRSMIGAVVIIITVLATASPNFQSGSFVFGSYINESGWNNGVAWILGLLQSESACCCFLFTAERQALSV